MLLGCWLFALMPGCTYTKDRIQDFSDIIHVGFGFVGSGISVSATNYVQGGIGISSTRYRADLLTWLTLGIGPAYGIGDGVKGPYKPVGEFGVAPFFFFRGSELTSHRETGTSSTAVMFGKTLLNANHASDWTRWYDESLWTLLPDKKEYEKKYDRRFLDLGFSTHGLLGFEAYFDPSELVDFFLGFFTVDLLDDDTKPASKSEYLTDA